MNEQDLELIVKDIKSCTDCNGFIATACKYHRKMLNNDKRNTRFQLEDRTALELDIDLNKNWNKFCLIGWCFTLILLGYSIPRIMEILK